MKFRTAKRIYVRLGQISHESVQRVVLAVGNADFRPKHHLEGNNHAHYARYVCMNITELHSSAYIVVRATLRHL